MTTENLNPPLDWDQVAEAINSFSGELLDLALVVLAMGTISMALVDVLKGVFRLRYFFHKWYLARWLRPSMSQESAADKNQTNSSDVDVQLLELSAGTGSLDLLPWPFGELSTSDLFSRIRGAAQSALDFPKQYEDLFDFLTNGIAGADSWKEAAKGFRGGVDGPTEPGEDDLGDLRLRLGHIVDRRLDVKEADAKWFWNRVNQAAALVLSAVLFSYVLIVYADFHPAQAITLSVFGGIVAPFAKDLVSRVTAAQINRGVGK